MSTLNGQPIKDTYQGLIKTTDNGVLGATPKILTDGLGNDSTLALGTAGATITGNLDLTGATVTGIPNTTYDLAAAQNLTNVDITLTGSDATVDTIQLTAGTNITLTEAAGSITIDAAGGGGATPPIDLKNLPPWGGLAVSGRYSYRTWCATNGYSLAGDAVAPTLAAVSIFSMREGEKINRLICGVDTAQPGAILNIAVYEIIEVNGYTKLGNKLKDIAAVDASTTGSKIIDIQSDPFIMPTGQDFGAIGIAHSFTVAGCSIEAWNQTLSGAWTGNGGADSFGTFYRAMGLFVKGIVNGVLPADLSANDVEAETGLPVYSLISSGTQNATT